MATKRVNHFFSDAWIVLRDSFNGFLDDRCLKLSAALAYYTVFSLAPLLVLIMSLTSIFLGEEAIRGQIFGQLNGLVGNEAAKQIQDMIKSVGLSGKTNTALAIGIITLVIGATSIFIEIQDSVNLIWRVKAKPKRGWLKLIKDRLLSSSLVVSLGFLLLVSLVINGLVLALSNQLTRLLPGLGVYIVMAFNFLLSTSIITILFGIIFKVLPDAKIAWKDVRLGAVFTALLFMLGRYLIGLYIETTSTSSTYGAAGSLIVILTWIYYTAAILYFGAEFTQAYANHFGIRIEPADYAVYVEQTERERDVSEIPIEKKVEQAKQ
ncbi:MULTISPECIES: YihY/virulence factor BrkB family protein [unclassified Spirosoma]|uniref:YihY/virulence factor BrkB family protein n=1 Tax=unclassified Spirosoma TaxID=2621999 RepID=UPI0009639603|nr:MULTISPECIES: YihY/virulence factor BrkB family protein [unclassified Spirosoma]MBN8823505.1 YihY/virulence factor BrkB family protein [Spirosoma sp.]OJW71887.1 MAG: ribonuclease BN [Spirosoma sp. 48-14]